MKETVIVNVGILKDDIKYDSNSEDEFLQDNSLINGNRRQVWWWFYEKKSIEANNSNNNNEDIENIYKILKKNIKWLLEKNIE